MRVTFVLPNAARVPMGGVRIVAEHARRLAARGHTVTLVGPLRPGDGLRDRLLGLAVAIRDQLHGVAGAPYYCPPGVDVRVLPSPRPDEAPDADVVVATGWQTARWVAEWPGSKGRKAYFVQNDERYQDPRAVSTWRLPLARITCAEWLRDAVEEAGGTVLGVVPNAVDADAFGLDRPVRDRGPRVLWLYHRLAVKGPDDAIAASRRIRDVYPGAEVDVFAARPPEHRLPSWMRVHVRPDPGTLRDLYNQAAVFLHTSQIEGWGLPPMEAMACGAAVVAYSNRGVQEFLDATCGRLVPIGDVEGVAGEVISLLRQPQERERIALAALARVSEFSWETHSAHFESLLERIVAGEGVA